jgi:tagatose 1,6-diphosphate aldolase
MSLSEGKIRRLAAIANDHGVIAAAAMDHRGALKKALAAARGVDMRELSAEAISSFKMAVSRVLSPYASAILLDPVFGLEAARVRAKGVGLLLAYELSGYDNTRPGRLPDLLPHFSVKRLVDWGADAVSINLYYSYREDSAVNDVKHAFVERIGAECEAHQMPFFLESVGYDPVGGDERTVEFAGQKPEIVTRTMEEFSKPQYKVDVLKVEFPVNAEFIPGTAVFRGPKAYTRDEALRHFRTAAAAAAKPFIYLSTGVSHAHFMDLLQMAKEAGTDHSGVLCGRATWKDGIPVYGQHGPRALEEWLQKEGVRRISAVNEAIRTATPWFEKLGIAAPA